MSSSTTIHQTKKKQNVRQKLQSPFPVPIQSLTYHWYQFTGKLEENHVVVQHSGDINYLHNMGFFGQGMMSRGPPATYDSLPAVYLPLESEHGEEFASRRVKVMRRRMYLRHKQWQKRLQCTSSSVDSDSDLDEEFNSDVEYNQYGCASEGGGNKVVHAGQQGSDVEMEHSSAEVFKVQAHSCDISEFTDKKETGQTNSFQSADQLTSDTKWGSTSSNEHQLPDVLNTRLNKSVLEKETFKLWNSSKSDSIADALIWDSKPANKKTVEEAWNDMEADADFWGTEPVTKRTKMEDFWATEPVLKKSKTEDILSGSSQDNCYNGETDESKIEQTASSKSRQCDSGDHAEMVTSESEEIQNSNINHNIDSGRAFHNNYFNDETDDGKHAKNYDNDIEIEKNNIEIEVENGTRAVLSKTCDTRNEEISAYKQGDENGSLTAVTDSSSLQIHPYCKNDYSFQSGKNDEDFDPEPYLVIDDSDVDDATVTVPRKEKYRWKPALRLDAFQFNEPLILSFEEAFFLTYGLGCLSVQNEDQSMLKISDLWRHFCRKRARFLPMYAAYHFFRSHGWVPKSGILFGVDYVLYKVGPPFYHATYSVVVKAVEEGSYTEMEHFNNRQFTWTSLSGLNRVTEHVAKTLVFCYVIFPTGWNEVVASSPTCLSQIRVKLQVISRWVSSQERNKSLSEVQAT
ncbi:uncharacterized protein LOC127846933 [Dreissena polymorpha]|nr:uncharacterized protein LOC127846933 [Dreissena polymorpha]XP_052234318.1 uncharacterized protein LOC127846933 [Dreissena polymorpha]XP_052234320.1 uncharacterized protein LOC127846933 [Dreissena polymorpha]